WRSARAGERARLAWLARTLAPDADAAALFLALSAGERAAVSPDLEQAFALSGLAHVLSVSGLHVAAFAACVFWLTRRLAVRGLPALTRTLEPRRLAVPLAGVATWLYVVFTGAAPPAVRSALMVSAVLLGVLTGRRSSALGALALAACALAAVDPAACADLSVQLSFVSVLGLVLLGPALRALVPLPPVLVTVHGLRRAWWLSREAVLQGACASAAATLATAPLLALAFHRLGLAGIVSNAVCLPLCSALSVVAAFSALVSASAPGLAVPLVALGTKLSAWLIVAARGFAQLPGAGLTVPAPGALAMSAWWGGLLAFAVLGGRRRFLALLTLPALVLTAAPWGLRERAPLAVTFLSVGHGDAIVISSRGHHALVDGGGVPHGADVGRRVVLPFLQQHGIDHLALAALSHPHPDHALGLASTLAAVPTARLWLPRGASDGPLVRAVVDAAKGAEVSRVELGAAPLSLGEATLRVLGPPVDRELLEGENDRSLVLSLTHGEVTFLLTGDLEAPGEEALTTGPVTVLKAPHHGSRTSSTPALVAAARPRHVVFCVGRRNRFGFPHGEVVERYRAAGARCHRTDLDGAVTFESDGHDVRVSHFLPGDQSMLGGLERR
ncbi:MAG: DNA internalization-related competence protein ComEC/Rec2, partial [Myxococcaceae bacterium]|nr:DNA internalization-related competence protein ComEC/Rec2 [Myxococcaceae bacterium]